MAPSYWTDSLVGYNLFSDRRALEGTTAKILCPVQGPGDP
jgi:hypothetical protein